MKKTRSPQEYPCNLPFEGHTRILPSSHGEPSSKAYQRPSTSDWKLIRYQELAQWAEFSAPALKKHLAIPEETYIIKLLKPFYTNRQLEIVKNPKVYFWDLGLKNYLARDFRPLSQRPDKGAWVENGSVHRSV
jgi:hypothetical protein